MDYISKIKSATSVEDLYRLREEFRGIELECNLASKGPDGIDINAWSEASFHRNAVEKQIAYLETKGVFLADVSVGGGDGLKAENEQLKKTVEDLNARIKVLRKSELVLHERVAILDDRIGLLTDALEDKKETDKLIEVKPNNP